MTKTKSDAHVNVSAWCSMPRDTYFTLRWLLF